MSQSNPGSFADNLMKVLMSIITVSVTAMLGFLWQINATISVLEEKDRNKETKIDNLQSTINQIRMVQQESREKSILMDSRLQNIETNLIGRVK